MKQRIKWLLVIAVALLSVSAIVFAGTVGDINGDGEVGLEEAIYALQVVAGLGPETTVEECITCEGTLSAGGRWCDQGNGTVKDVTTGLVWLKDAFWGSMYPFWVDSMIGMNAHDRAAQVKNGTPASLTDGSVEGNWRLPTKEELHGLANGSEAVRCTSGSCNVNGFTGVQSVNYWSSTTVADYALLAKLVNMNNGNALGGNKDFTGAYVWPVRSDN